MTYHPDQDFTWALWFKPSGSNNDDEMLISRRRYHGDSDQINMSMTYYADGRVRMHFSGDHLHSGTAFSETLCNDGEWHHGAVVRDTATRKYLLYVDGELEKTLDDLGQDYSAAASCRIGQEGETYGGNRQYHGLIDDVRIYHRAFSRTEIRALYQN